jgi:N-acetyl-alpha-D-glucosaminyl L-malate synthase BshA
MRLHRRLNIGITCYPLIGGSGTLAVQLGDELARCGHEIHFISYERPYRLARDTERQSFHPVRINHYELFKYPDYTLPLSVKMAEVSRRHQLDILHVHYAVPHATAALLARSMLHDEHRPKIITTLHGTDTTLLGRDPGYRPAIRHALEASDAVTAVSEFLRQETRHLLGITRTIDVIPNFFNPRPTDRSRAAVRAELGVDTECLLVHASNLRPIKRIDRLLQVAARIRPRSAFKLLILAGGDFQPFESEVAKLELTDRVIVRARVHDVENYLQAADLAVFTSDCESFCLGVLEAMYFGCPCVATSVGGIPEVVMNEITGLLAPAADIDALARAVELLIHDPARRAALASSGRARARRFFSGDAVVPQYLQLYRRVCAHL